MRKTALIENWQDVTPNWGACRAMAGARTAIGARPRAARGPVSDGSVWDDVSARFANGDRVISVSDLGKIVHLWITREDVPRP